VFDESLRLQPTVPGYYRAAREDTVLAGIHPMRKGDWALALTDPARVKSRPGGLSKPFGTGERSCIGRQFALQEAILILGTLIRRYDLIPDPDYRLAITERLTMMPGGFRLGLRRR
jgi:unspecific monooxygenase